jgi:hypothetical protein
MSDASADHGGTDQGREEQRLRVNALQHAQGSFSSFFTSLTKRMSITWS